MKIINTDNITWPIAVDSADSDYPVTNIETDIRTKVWKAAAADVSPKMTVTMTTGADSLGVANTNATSILVVVKDNASAVVSSTSYTMGDYSKDIFVPYTVQNTAHTIEITFTAGAGAVPECGIIRAGLALEIRDPEYGLKEGLVDTSISRELNSGALYYKQRSILRIFSGQVLLERADDFYDYLYDVVREHGRSPLFWQITDVNALEWAVFGSLTGLPTGQHSYYSHSQIPFSIQESL